MTRELPVLMSDLADLMRAIPPDRFGAPTPCPEFDVAALRQHVLSWLPVFAAALTDPDGDRPRPDPQSYRASSDAGAAAAEVLRAARQVSDALDAGVAGRPVQLFGSPLPGTAVVGMLTAEVIAHGWDLARGTGQAWDPSPAACREALAALRGMLTDEFRGPSRSFGAEVAVPDDASPLEALLAFSGRNPAWSNGPVPHE